MLKSIMKNTMRILIWKIYVWDYWGPYAQHISRVELTKYANTKLFLRHLNKSKKSEIFILYKDLTLSEPSRGIKSYKGHENRSKIFKNAFFHGKYIFETTHHDMICVLSKKESKFNAKNGSTFSHLLTVRAGGADPCTPPPYGEPDCKKIVLFLTTPLTS